ncbi:hypothetical protein [Salinibacter sp.]|uniref:hypothetical protein n=1 Tax=Salinibacter sp. TaxID=2065818 RepID=UPI0021E8D597|nr:hypothetical protein [Salinibacter sp.]
MDTTNAHRSSSSVESGIDPMTDAPPTDETVVLATYANRQDAEVACARLAGHDIDAVVVADDVHPLFQFTEGVELRGLEGMATPARRILGEEPRLSAEDRTGALSSTEKSGPRRNSPGPLHSATVPPTASSSGTPGGLSSGEA